MATLDVLALAEAKDGLNEEASVGLDNELPGWITAVSQRLDKLVGPIVRRTVTSEKHNGGEPVIHLRLWPVYSITTVTEYENAAATILTAETNLSQPADAYIVDSYEPALTLADGTQLDLLSRSVYRRSSGSDTRFPAGRRNVDVAYVPGRFVNTASVDERYKKAAILCLQNIWQSQRIGTARMGEFDVPVSTFPRFAIPNAVKELFPGEIQEASTRFLVG